MHKCLNCGKEFDGNFCPSCGEKFGNEKKCPNCGKILSETAKFCNECGYSFNNGKSNDNKIDKQPLLKQLLSWAKYFPFVAFSIFVVFLFSFYSLPVAELVIGSGFPNESLGNVYSMDSGILSEIPQAKSALIALIIIASFSLLCVIFMGICLFVKRLYYKDVTLFNKWKVSLNSISITISFVLYFIIFIIGIAAVVIIKKFDEGMGLITSGSCIVLLIVFSLLLAIISCASILFRFFMAKKQPEIFKQELAKKQKFLETEKDKKQRKIDEENRRKQEFYQTHTPPVQPVLKSSKRQYRIALIKYKHEKRNYDKAIEKTTPKFVLWLDINKIIISVVAIFLMVAITLTCILVPMLTNVFRLNVVDRIDLGDTPEQVESVLGSPYEITNKDSVWKYYDSEHASILNQLKDNEEALEKAGIKGDITALERLTEKEEKLKEQKQNDTYAYIEICFEQNENEILTVSSVYFDKNMNTEQKNEKEIEQLEFEIYNNVKVNYYSDYSSKSVKQTLINNYKNISLDYSAYFTDGSLYKAKTNSAEPVSLSGNTATFSWSDKLITYKQESSLITKNEIGKISADGAWQTTDKTISSLAIPNGVLSLNDNSFTGCNNLTNVELPSSVTSISDGAFNNLSNLEFNEYLNAKYLGDSENPFSTLIKVLDTTLSSYIINPDTKIICGSAFNSCINLENIIIPEQVTQIGDNAFYNCANLSSIKIPSSVNCMGNKVFYNCTNLSNVTFETDSSLTAFESETFSNCTALSNIIIPDSVTSIKDRAFYNCLDLENITISSALTDIDKNAFFGCPIKTATLPAIAVSSLPKTVQTVTINGGAEIIAESFKDCIKLTSVSIPNNITRINSNAFENCNNLASITLPDSVIYVGPEAFKDCTSLQTITFPCASVSNDTFSNCPIKTATLSTDGIGSLPKTVQTVVITSGSTINGFAFKDCAYLTSITIPSSVTSIGTGAFYGCPIETANIPTLAISYIPKTNLKTVVINSGESINFSALNSCSSLQSISVFDNSENYASHDGILYNKTKTEIILVPKAISGSVTIPNGITSIGYNVFSGRSSLQSVTIPNSVSFISSKAFDGCDSLQYNEYCNALYLGNNENKYLALIKAKNTSVTSCEIGVNTKFINSSAFTNCPIETANIPTYAISYIPKTNLKTVTINSGESIDSYAFRDCTSLQSITIPSSVTSIGVLAFYGCDNLQSITIPSSVTSIGDAFYGCPIENANIPTFAISYIPKTNLKTLVINSGENIGDNAFYGCDSLQSITIPSSVTSIGTNAFYGCHKLIEVINKSTLNIIKDSPDYGYIGYYAKQIITDELDSKILYDGDYSFYNDNDTYYLLGYHGTETELTLPNKINGKDYKLHNYVFYHNNTITSVVLSNSLTSIENYTFNNCRNLKSITIPSSVTSIGGYYAFYGCPIETANIPTLAISYIEHDHLKTVVINSGENIGDKAFNDCDSLQSITIPSSVTNISENAFNGCIRLQSITVDESNANYSSLDGILYNKTKTEIILVPKAISGSVTIPSSIIRIGASAFSSCSNLKSITLPSTVTSIGNHAFSGCNNLETVNYLGTIDQWAMIHFNGYIDYMFYSFTSNPLNNGIAKLYIDNALITQVILTTATEINFASFYGYSFLESIKISSSVTSISSGAFSNCNSLQNITVESGNTTYHSKDNCLIETATNTLIFGCKNSIIPNYVTSIGDFAFNECSSLESITIPSSVTSIGDSAFNSCSSLANINYNGTIAQWNAISKSYYYWDSNTGDYTIHCTDGDIAKS